MKWEGAGGGEGWKYETLPFRLNAKRTSGVFSFSCFFFFFFFGFIDSLN